ncbi:MAG: class I SAM-dependent methyltransferase [Magnetococcales bacterium]|nr:class I SAM-dependent methyltransferase [Magnetococcales bacterium]MBF0322122.1 class I SAM-dependent methyltransferase [Magnetococcales bacterium]
MLDERRCKADSRGAIAVSATDWSLQASAQNLATSLQLPFVTLDSHDYAFLLTCTPERLELRATGPDGTGPVYVFFDPGDWINRNRPGQGRQRDLAVAMGLRRSKLLPTILDATAGLGRDAYALALLGCKVTMMERSPIVAALLWDGLERALREPLIAPLVERNLIFVPGNAVSVMQTGGDDAVRPDVVYLDPMHPPRTKSALVRKEMRHLRVIVGDDMDSQDLLTAALGYARRRVVLKRPRRAEWLSPQHPSYIVSGRTVRYEVYLI